MKQRILSRLGGWNFGQQFGRILKIIHVNKSIKCSQTDFTDFLFSAAIATTLLEKKNNI